MAATDPVTPEPRRFSLRLPSPLSMLVSTVALIVMSVGLLVGIPAYRQQSAIGEIKRLGGQIETRPRGPKWMRDAMGEERMQPFDDVVEVKLRDTRANDAALVYVGRLGGLQRLWLANTRLTDAGLVHLTGLTRLEELSLAQTDVIDNGLIQLRELTKLRWLYLGSTQISSAGATELERNMPGLTIFR
jgi:hypothetical protein